MCIRDRSTTGVGVFACAGAFAGAGVFVDADAFADAAGFAGGDGVRTGRAGLATSLGGSVSRGVVASAEGDEVGGDEVGGDGIRAGTASEASGRGTRAGGRGILPPDFIGFCSLAGDGVFGASGLRGMRLGLGRSGLSDSLGIADFIRL